MLKSVAAVRFHIVSLCYSTTYNFCAITKTFLRIDAHSCFSLTSHYVPFNVVYYFRRQCKYLCTTYPGKQMCYGYEYQYDTTRCELHAAEVMAGDKKDDVDCYIGRDCDEDNSKHSATYTRLDGVACKPPKKSPDPRKIFGVDSDECKRICTRDPTSEHPKCVGFEYGGDRNQPCELFSEGKLKAGGKKDGYNCWVKN